MLHTVRALSALALILAGCGAAGAQRGPDKKPEAHARSSPEPDLSASAPKPPPDRLKREDIKATLPYGLPWVFKRVLPKDEVRDGKFFGWQLTAIPEEWQGLDVRPEDIVTKVNGKSLETPDQIWEAWVSLATATELRVAYERNGEAREFVLPIEGPPATELSAALLSASPPPRKPSLRKSTIVIESRDPAGDVEDN